MPVPGTPTLTLRVLSTVPRATAFSGVAPE